MIKLLKFVPLNVLLIGTLTSGMSQIPMGQIITGENNADFFGKSVDISSNGTRIVVGADMNDGNGLDAGHARVLEFSGASWIQLGDDIDGQNTSDLSGGAVSISGDGETISIGAKFNDGNGSNSGHVRVYRFNGSSWYQIGNDIVGESGGDQCGFSVALSGDGNRVIVGSPKHISIGIATGQARVYQYNGTDWVQVGPSLLGEAAQDEYGSRVSMSYSGNIVAVSSMKNSGNGQKSGHVRIFKFDSLSTTGWVQMGADIDGESAQDLSGSSISLNAKGNVVAIGATNNSDNGPQAGHVRVFIYDTLANSWNQFGSDIDGEFSQDHFGASVDIDNSGTKIVVGSPFNDDSDTDGGQVNIFTFNGINWVQDGDDLNGLLNDELGTSVAISGNGNVMVAGAPTKNGITQGTVTVYNLNAYVGIADSEVSQVKVYPNPTQGNLTVEGDYDLLTIYDQSGRFIKSWSKLDQVSLSGLNSGLYLLEVRQGNVSVTKMVQKID